MALLKRLSKHARAEVFLALRAEGADRLCVVTLLAPSLVASPEVLDGLRSQATWLVGRVHGNLVQIYDVGQSGEQVFFVSEYVEGADLGAVLDRAGALEPSVAAYIALEVGEAIAFIRAHEEPATAVPTRIAGLSAASVLVAREGQVKVLHQGSGLASPPDRLAERSARVVSLVAPEHVSGGGSPAGDVFAIGALLSQMLTGRPLAGDDVVGHLARLKSGAFVPEPPSAILGEVSAIPPALDKLVTAALAPRPEDRPADFAALRAELVAAMRSLADSDERGVRRLMGEVFGVELANQGKEIARLTSAAAETLGISPKQPALTLTNISGVRRPLPAESELVLGETIPGTRYRALEKLGEGGMGAVFLAEHVDIERKVALKLLHADLVQNPLVLRQFRQEARAASRIGNPYICDVTDWGEVQDGRVFFVMEYLDGPSLAKVLRDERRFGPARMIPILRQVAKALGAAHEKGIVHLDVKPDNVILFEKQGRGDVVKVVDFGIAGLLGQGSSGGKVMGTPEYMAPERAQGQGYDHRSDIYSLGVMAWEMLVGEVPFQAASPMDTLAMHVDETPDRINERLTNPVPNALEAVIMRMIDKDPARRPATMAEVETLLIEAQIEARIRTPFDEELTLPAMDPDRAVRLSRQLSPIVRRTRLSLAVASTVAALSVSSAVYFAVRDPDAASQRQMAPRPAPTPVAAAPVITPTPRPAPPPAVPVAPVPQTPAPTPAATPPPPVEPARKSRPSPTPAVRDPAKARAAVARGKEAFASGSFAQAANEYRAAVEADPTNPQALFGLAETEYENARYPTALQYARAAARLAPRSAQHHVLVAQCHFKLKQYAQAIRAYETAAKLSPSDPTIQHGMDLVKRQLGQK